MCFICICILRLLPPHGQELGWRQFLSRVLVVWIQIFNLFGRLSKQIKETSLIYYFSIDRGGY